MIGRFQPLNQETHSGVTIEKMENWEAADAEPVGVFMCLRAHVCVLIFGNIAMNVAKGVNACRLCTMFSRWIRLSAIH